MHKQPDHPKLAFPFHLLASGTRAAVHDMDSDAEIMDCVQVLLATEIGSREEIPSYGLEDQAFKERGADTEQILTAISKWEPRAERFIEEGDIESFIQHVQVKLVERGGD